MLTSVIDLATLLTSYVFFFSSLQYDFFHEEYRVSPVKVCPDSGLTEILPSVLTHMPRRCQVVLKSF